MNWEATVSIIFLINLIVAPWLLLRWYEQNTCEYCELMRAHKREEVRTN